MKRVVEEVVVTDPLGIHARPAAALAIAVSRSGARVSLQLGSKKVNAASMVGLLSLGASHNSRVTVEVEGDDDAIAAVLVALRESLAPPAQT